jgi:hypothetical protein
MSLSSREERSSSDTSLALVSSDERGAMGFLRCDNSFLFWRLRRTPYCSRAMSPIRAAEIATISGGRCGWQRHRPVRWWGQQPVVCTWQCAARLLACLLLVLGWAAAAQRRPRSAALLATLGWEQLRGACCAAGPTRAGGPRLLVHGFDLKK